MNLLNIASLFIIFLITIFFSLFLISSIREQKPRAAWLSLGIVILTLLLIFIIYNYQAWTISYILNLLIFNGVLLFFLPLHKPKSLKIGKMTERVDERDTMFAREEYKIGTEKYKTYYTSHPEFKRVDDSLRKLPKLLDPGGKYYDLVKSKEIKKTFGMITDLTTQVDGKVNENKSEIDPVKVTRLLKDLIIEKGADEVGVCELNPMFIYSHVGRGPEEWGSKINLDHSI